jgi:phospho-N-acetylmuramoyl-pentapeptide-transferase
MGGLLIRVSLVVSTLLWARLDNRFVLLALAGTVWLGFLGFWDDYLKLVKKNPKGLHPQMKFLGQLVLAATAAVYLWCNPAQASFASRINIPYLKDVFVDLSMGYILFVIIVIVGSSNGVNLTDGLDGLAIGNIIIAALTFIVFAYVAGNIKLAHYLRVVPVPGSGELCVFLAALVGSGLGFLWFNSFPAQVFMGDTGSLFLGGALGMTAVIIKQELILVVIGGVFVIETLSVMLQVFSFKRFGKRIFKMAPIHHHFELCNWAEPKVTVRFWIIGAILALVALSSLKLR